nr:hypothetical protein [Deinococcus phoenicis]
MPLTVGVGHQEDPFSPVVGTKGGSRETVPLRIKPHFGQVPQNSSEKPSGVISEKSGVGAAEDAGDVLSHHPARPKLANNTGELSPEVAFICARQSFSGDGVRLTGPSSANKVNRSKVVFSDMPHVLVSLRLRPVLVQDQAGVFLAFDLPKRLGAAQAHLKAEF